MSFLEMAKKRYSARKFTEQQVEQEKIDQILEVAKIAPTAHNNQPQHIIVINEPQMLEKLKDCTAYTFHAPLNFLICYDSSKSWVRAADNKEMGHVDAAIIATHMMMMIDDIGLGATWVGGFDPAKVKALFNLPDNIIPVAFLPTGYPVDPPRVSPLHEQRIAISDFVSYNKFWFNPRLGCRKMQIS